MIKDTQQKLKAIRYCVSLGYIPHMEVQVRYQGDTGDKPSDLTDVDVLALFPSMHGKTKRIIFDCKTLNKVSPINRAFWAKGLMALTNSDEAFVILGRPAIESHRLAGNSFGVRLFSEQLFEAYAVSASSDFLVPNSYLERIDAWERLSKIRKNYPILEELISYINSGAQLQTSGSQGVRGLISIMKNVSGELDPSKAEHRALFKLVLSQFCFFVNEMLRDYHNIFDPQVDRVGFERTLRYYLWGGKESYDLRQRLNSSLKNARGVSEFEPFELPAWDVFVEFFRSCLDSPFSISAICLPIKDLAFRELTSPSLDIDNKNSTRLKVNNRVRQFSLLSASYLCEAVKIPNEFRNQFINELNMFIV